MDVLAQEYTVDGQDGIRDPGGMIGTRLEVSVHIVTSPITVRQNILTSVARANLSVLDTVLAPLAAAEAVLTEDEKEFGVALVNIGGETTSIAVFQRGAVRYTGVIPVGGNHFTSDIALGLRTPIPEAERIKRQFGCAMTTLISDAERSAVIEVPTVNGRQPMALSRQILCDILQSRAEEIMSHVHQEILRAGFDRQLCSGIVLTGGGAMMDGLLEVAERVINLPIRIGVPEGVGGLTERISSPAYATAVGLVLHGYRKQADASRSIQRSDNGLSKATARLRGWLGGFLS
jgi:cell division protein FtsA